MTTWDGRRLGRDAPAGASGRRSAPTLPINTFASARADRSSLSPAPRSQSIGRISSPAPSEIRFAGVATASPGRRMHKHQRSIIRTSSQTPADSNSRPREICREKIEWHTAWRRRSRRETRSDRETRNAAMANRGRARPRYRLAHLTTPSARSARGRAGLAQDGDAKVPSMLFQWCDAPQAPSMPNIIASRAMPPQQTINGSNTASTARPVSVSCARANPIQ